MRLCQHAQLRTPSRVPEGGMKTMRFVSLSALGLILLSAPASGQQAPLAQQLIGAWTLVASYQERPDGTRFDTFGPNPKGIMIFDPTGRMSLTMARSDRPKFS